MRCRMKVWQLSWLVSDSDILPTLLAQHPEWEKYQRLLDNPDPRLTATNRGPWGEEVDPQLTRAALQVWPHQFWIDKNEYLVEYLPSDKDVTPDRVISANNAFERYAADA